MAARERFSLLFILPPPASNCGYLPLQTVSHSLWTLPPLSHFYTVPLSVFSSLSRSLSLSFQLPLSFFADRYVAQQSLNLTLNPIMWSFRVIVYRQRERK